VWSSIFKNPARRLQELRLLIQLVEQAVLAVEQIHQVPGPEKKKLVLSILADLLPQSGLDPPARLLDTVIESSIRLTK
jgi:hypothetical protein